MDRKQFYREVTGFLTKVSAENGTPGSGTEALATDIGEDSNLFDLGLINSFTVIRMIVFIEDLTGAQIDLAEHDLETFYTLRGLYTVANGADQ
ncbi:acyl carrier protein [Actinoplanes xinjiangensis]|uniref:Carrier domain-containing protein n=1 Tax=Actinoplanes xinjiangensis TaxID=512350 RepID=A0A316EXC0_9ACTN|nr:acyl carrier protein [Actinoplanes xinjiangensis]PWK36088.1 hypothetical protein BC793_12469 [Actinoplanes xinjiangensis]GIF42908.1 hypothetical protein Axi01nite_72190 [Actinoplanes xinjiangensis]